MCICVCGGGWEIVLVCVFFVKEKNLSLIISFQINSPFPER